jgi:hypothetical protein
VFSIVVFRLADASLFDSVKDRIEADPRLKLEAKPEIRFYAEQSEALATFINILGLSLAVIFSIGAVVGAMITMFAAVAQRTGEIGTLRALGFRRGAVLAAFLWKVLLLSAIGGVLGLAAASGMQAVDVSTTNFQTFSRTGLPLRADARPSPGRRWPLRWRWAWWAASSRPGGRRGCRSWTACARPEGWHAPVASRVVTWVTRAGAGAGPQCAA